MNALNHQTWSWVTGTLTLVAIAPITLITSQSQVPADIEDAIPDKVEQPLEQLEAIADLPDANFRYVTAPVSSSEVTDEGVVIVSDEALQQAGGYVFLFRKTSDQIVGTLHHLESGNKICVSGQLDGENVVGQAIERIESPFKPPNVLSAGETFTRWDLDQILRVNQGTQTGTRIQYRGATLDLSRFNRINTGTQPPPEACV